MSHLQFLNEKLGKDVVSHWEFLNEKLGKDVVSHCIQPFLLPVLGFDTKELHELLMRELRIKLIAKQFSDAGYQELVRQYPRYRDEIASDLRLFRMKLSMRSSGCKAARTAKDGMIRDLHYFYFITRNMKRLLPSTCKAHCSTYHSDRWRSDLAKRGMSD